LITRVEFSQAGAAGNSHDFSPGWGSGSQVELKNGCPTQP